MWRFSPLYISSDPRTKDPLSAATMLRTFIWEVLSQLYLTGVEIMLGSVAGAKKNVLHLLCSSSWGNYLKPVSALPFLGSTTFYLFASLSLCRRVTRLSLEKNCAASLLLFFLGLFKAGCWPSFSWLNCAFFYLFALCCMPCRLAAEWRVCSMKKLKNNCAGSPFLLSLGQLFKAGCCPFLSCFYYSFTLYSPSLLLLVPFGRRARPCRCLSWISLSPHLSSLTDCIK